MKHFIQTLALVFIVTAGISLPQIKQGTVELSLFGTAGVSKYKAEYTETSSFGSSGTSTTTHSSANPDAQKFLMMFLRPGYFFADNIAFEPEIMITAIEKSKPAFSFSANLTYNFSIPKSIAVPFIFAGYGLGNGLPTNRTITFRQTDDFDVNFVNLGGGVKLKLGENFAFRCEYRYQNFSWERTDSYSAPGYSQKYTAKIDYDFHNLFFGFSYFLN